MWPGCRAFSADKHILCDQTVRVTDRFGFFDAVVTPVALCGAGHRPNHKRHFQTMDCAFRKPLRQRIRPRVSVVWTPPWRDILHNCKKNETITKQHDLEIWFRKCLKQNLDLLFYIASLPTNRWVRRVLCWWPLDRRRPGNPRQHWFTKIIAFSRYKQMGTSENVTPKAKPGCELQTTLLCSQILLQE